MIFVLQPGHIQCLLRAHRILQPLIDFSEDKLLFLLPKDRARCGPWGIKGDEIPHGDIISGAQPQHRLQGGEAVIGVCLIDLLLNVLLEVLLRPRWFSVKLGPLAGSPLDILPFPAGT